MQKISLTILFLLLLFSASGQQSVTSENEKRMSVLFDSLKISNTDEESEKLNNEIIKVFSEELKNPDSFTKDYTSLQYVGKIFSDDNKIKIYSWSYPLSDKTYGYGGFIQYRAHDKTIRTIPLQIKEKAYLPLNSKRIPTNDWYGALYYKIIPVKHKKENYYVILGWAGNNAASDFKMIDILNIEEDKNRAYFGRLVLKHKNRTLQRFVLEYSADAQVSLVYDASTTKIIFDHLVPSEPVYQDVYSFYGPDFTYDAFALKKGIWYLEENVDVKNKE